MARIKRLRVRQEMEIKHYKSLDLIRQTHLRPNYLSDVLSSVKDNWSGDVFINGISSNCRGLMILIKNSFEYQVCGVHSDELGNMLMIDIKINYTNYLLLNIYGPNTDNPVFFLKIYNNHCRIDSMTILSGVGTLTSPLTMTQTLIIMLA